MSYEIPNQPGIKKVMRVNDLDRTAREAMFKPDGSSAPISVEAYFKHAKRYSLQFPNMPCLWVGSKTREDHMLFPAELCTVVGGQVCESKTPDITILARPTPNLLASLNYIVDFVSSRA